MCMFSLQLQAAEGDTIMTEGFVSPDVPIDWSASNNSFSSNNNGLFAGDSSIKLKDDVATITTAEYENVNTFSFYYMYTLNSADDGVITVEKSTDGTNWNVVQTFVVGDEGAKNAFTYKQIVINEAVVTLRVSWAHLTKDIWLDDFCLTALPPIDNVDVLSVSADTITVSYEDIQFSLKEGTDDTYLAHDSIAYGDDAVTITALPVAPAASITYTKQTVNPLPGMSDTAVFEVKAEDGVTTKTYKAIVARSAAYVCKQGFLTNELFGGWTGTGTNSLSSTRGDGGMYPGAFGARIFDGSSKSAGSIITPKFDQVGSLTFSARFAMTAEESLCILTSINDGGSWDTVKIYKAGETDHNIPDYSTEDVGDALGREMLSINKQDVMIRFQYIGGEDTSRTMIDDIAIKATDYVDIPTGLETVKTSETSFKVYPNPASTYIQIDGDVSSVSIYSLTGRLVKTVTNEKTINVQSLKSGIYLVKTDNDIQQLIIK